MGSGITRPSAHPLRARVSAAEDPLRDTELRAFKVIEVLNYE
jgi:hypothetical protein